MITEIMEMSSPVHGASAELIGEVARRAGGVGCHWRSRLKLRTKTIRSTKCRRLLTPLPPLAYSPYLLRWSFANRGRNSLSLLINDWYVWAKDVRLSYRCGVVWGIVIADGVCCWYLCLLMVLPFAPPVFTKYKALPDNIGCVSAKFFK